LLRSDRLSTWDDILRRSFTRLESYSCANECVIKENAKPLFFYLLIFLEDLEGVGCMGTC